MKWISYLNLITMVIKTMCYISRTKRMYIFFFLLLMNILGDNPPQVNSLNIYGSLFPRDYKLWRKWVMTKASIWDKRPKSVMIVLDGFHLEFNNEIVLWNINSLNIIQAKQSTWRKQEAEATRAWAKCRKKE